MLINGISLKLVLTLCRKTITINWLGGKNLTITGTSGCPQDQEVGQGYFRCTPLQVMEFTPWKWPEGNPLRLWLIWYWRGSCWELRSPASSLQTLWTGNCSDRQRLAAWFSQLSSDTCVSMGRIVLLTRWVLKEEKKEGRRRRNLIGRTLRWDGRDTSASKNSKGKYVKRGMRNRGWFRKR